MTQNISFAPEGTRPGALHDNWSLLIVDDEPEVHGVTTLALADFNYAGRGIEFLRAYSGTEARQILADRPDIALVLLDVVMETDHAGLDVVEYVRNELHNKFIRIILRTGQPGQAPELDVIARYDINDYKHKTELTRERLYTSVHTGLSTYRDLLALDANRRGLSKVIDASARIFEQRSLQHFAQGVLEQLTALLFLDRDTLVVEASGLAAKAGDALPIVAATGRFEPLKGRDGLSCLPDDILVRLRDAQAYPGPHQFGDYLVYYQPGGDGESGLVFYLGVCEALEQADGDLISKFCSNVAIAFSNLRKLEQARGRRNGDRAD